MPTFPAWMIATLIGGIGVWAVAQIDTRAAWWLAILVVLSVLITRDESLYKLQELIRAMLSHTAPTDTAPVSTPNVPGFTQ